MYIYIIYVYGIYKYTLFYLLFLYIKYIFKYLNKLLDICDLAVVPCVLLHTALLVLQYILPGTKQQNNINK